mgnify:CR=1 FL=1
MLRHCKVVRVGWLRNLATVTTKKITIMLICFKLCVQSQLGSFVLGVMLHKSIGHLLIYISKPFVICAWSTSYFSREKENKNI